jgi:hypothetical protein
MFKPCVYLFLVCRSPFELSVVQQYVVGFQQTRRPSGEWLLHGDVKDLAETHFSGVFTTAPVEDLNGYMQNSHASRTSARFRRPESSLAAGVASKCLTHRHHYENPDVPSSLKRKAIRLVANAYGKKAPVSDLDMTGVSSTTQKADFFSPTAENVGLPTADLYALREADAHNRIHDLRVCFMGAFCEAENMVLWRREKDGGRWQHGGVVALWADPLRTVQLFGVASFPRGHPWRA